jgi:hypothetical protein
MLENTDHSAFPVLNGKGRPIGLIERDAMISMIENNCWYQREARMSGDFGKRPEEEVKHNLIAEKKEEGGEPPGRIKIERNDTAENERNIENHRILKTHTSSINDDEIRPI